MRRFRFLVPAVLLALASCGGDPPADVATVDPAAGTPAAPAATPAAEEPKPEPPDPVAIANGKLASDAYKEAAKLEKAAEAAGPDSPAQQQLQAFCKEKSDALAGKKLTRMGITYLGLIQSMGGMHQDAVLTLRKAVHDPRASQYAANMHAYLIDALVKKGDLTDAAVEVDRMAATYAGHKSLKKVAMNTGIALRGSKQFSESIKPLETALDANVKEALKPLVNSYLMAGNKEGAIKTVEAAIEKAADHQKVEFQPLLAITKKWGDVLPVEFVGFAPEPGPDLEGKVLVMGVWNVSAGTLKWTLKALENVQKGFGQAGVQTLAVSTYYKKDELTGTIKEDMTPAQEHEQALKVRDQWNLNNTFAWVKDEAAIDALGRSALPYFLVLDKDRRVVFAHVMDRGNNNADMEILYDVLKKALE